jgi:aldose sugar dehydrogenase
MVLVGHSVAAISTIIFLLFSVDVEHNLSATSEGEKIVSNEPKVSDPNLRIEIVASGLDLPTSMAFLGPDDILVLEKDRGTVKRIVGGEVLEEPVLDVNVANSLERGMLGIAVAHNEPNTNVFLYFTESIDNDGGDKCFKTEQGPIHCEDGNDPLGNRVYQYDFVNGKLVNPKLLLDLPAIPNRHNGGPVIIGRDQNLYVVIGDVDHRSQAQNVKDGVRPDGSGGILRVTQNGELVDGGILSNEHPLNLYYAYGIRNSFGMDFDPVTGSLWDTENGDENSDEINLVEPGFNSGWRSIMGMSSNEEEFNPTDLVNFRGNSKYSDPEFVWTKVVGPTAIEFLGSDELGEEYENDMFVGDFINGNIYHFELNYERDQLSLDGVLEDKIADNDNELQEITFGRNFGGIADIEFGSHDGFLYFVSIGKGSIFRISSSGEGK